MGEWGGGGGGGGRCYLSHIKSSFTVIWLCGRNVQKSICLLYVAKMRVSLDKIFLENRTV